MNIAEFFIKLGISGDGPALKTMKNVKNGLNELESSGLAVKAAMLAVAYGIERFTGAAGARGQSLMQFAAATGKSTQELQQWQQSLLGFGVKAEEVDGAVRGIVDSIAKMRMGMAGAPVGLGMLMSKTGLKDQDLDDPFKILKAIQAYSKMGDPAIIKQLTAWAGGDNMFQALRRFQGDASKVKNILSPGEIENLARVDETLNRIWLKIKMIGDHLVAKHGLFVLDDITRSIDMLSKLATGVNKLLDDAPKLKVAFVGLGLAIALAFAPITTLVTGIVFLLGEIDKASKGQANVFSTVGKWLDEHGMGSKNPSDISDYGGGDPMSHFGGSGKVPVDEQLKKMLTPKVAPPPEQHKGRAPDSVEVHVHAETQDPREHGRVAGREIIAAARTFSALVQNA